jgi:hypothetical protein
MVTNQTNQKTLHPDYEYLSENLSWDDKAPSNQTSCAICGKDIKKGMERVSLGTGAWRGQLTYTRFCKKCFLISLLYKYPELFNIADSKLKKEIFVARAFK